MGADSDSDSSSQPEAAFQRYLTGDLTSQNKTTELLEVVAAVVVTARLVGGNLLLFSPLRIDNRIKAPAPPAQPENAAQPMRL